MVVVVLPLNFFIQKQACPATLQSSRKLQTYIERKKQTEIYYANNTAKLSLKEVLFPGAFQDKYNHVIITNNSHFLDYK